MEGKVAMGESGKSEGGVELGGGIREGGGEVFLGRSRDATGIRGGGIRFCRYTFFWGGGWADEALLAEIAKRMESCKKKKCGSVIH